MKNFVVSVDLAAGKNALTPAILAAGLKGKDLAAGIAHANEEIRKYHQTVQAVSRTQAALAMERTTPGQSQMKLAMFAGMKEQHAQTQRDRIANAVGQSLIGTPTQQAGVEENVALGAEKSITAGKLGVQHQQAQLGYFQTAEGRKNLSQKIALDFDSETAGQKLRGQELKARGEVFSTSAGQQELRQQLALKRANENEDQKLILLKEKLNLADMESAKGIGELKQQLELQRELEDTLARQQRLKQGLQREEFGTPQQVARVQQEIEDQQEQGQFDKKKQVQRLNFEVQRAFSPQGQQELKSNFAMDRQARYLMSQMNFARRVAEVGAPRAKMERLGQQASEAFGVSGMQAVNPAILGAMVRGKAGSMVGSMAGGAIGTAIGGPAGTAIGSAIGGAGGAIVDSSVGGPGSSISYSTLTKSLELLSGEIGATLAPVLLDLAKVVQDGTQWFRELSPATKELIGIFLASALGLSQVASVLRIFVETITLISDIVVVVAGALRAVWQAIIEFIRSKIPAGGLLLSGVEQAGTNIARDLRAAGQSIVQARRGLAQAAGRDGTNGDRPLMTDAKFDPQLTATEGLYERFFADAAKGDLEQRFREASLRELEGIRRNTTPRTAPREDPPS